MQNFIKLSAAVHVLSCKRRNRETGKKLSDDAENKWPTAVASADINNSGTFSGSAGTQCLVHYMAS